MIMPTPKKNETMTDFVERCKNDETMKKEFTDDKEREQACRAAYLADTEKRLDIAKLRRLARKKVENDNIIEKS